MGSRSTKTFSLLCEPADPGDNRRPIIWMPICNLVCVERARGRLCREAWRVWRCVLWCDARACALGSAHLRTEWLSGEPPDALIILHDTSVVLSLEPNPPDNSGCPSEPPKALLGHVIRQCAIDSYFEVLRVMFYFATGCEANRGSQNLRSVPRNMKGPPPPPPGPRGESSWGSRHSMVISSCVASCCSFTVARIHARAHHHRHFSARFFGSFCGPHATLNSRATTNNSSNGKGNSNQNNNNNNNVEDLLRYCTLRSTFLSFYWMYRVQLPPQRRHAYTFAPELD